MRLSFFLLEHTMRELLPLTGDGESMKSEPTALLVVDAQRVYTDQKSELYCPASDKTIENINSLIDAFSEEKLPIFLIRHVHSVDGSDLGRMFDFGGPAADFNFKEGSEEVEYSLTLRRPPAAREIVKHRYSAFQGTDLDERLRALKVERVVICGFMTNFCCESTAREAHDRDYYVTFVTEATGCPALPQMSQEDIREVVATLLGAGFATITDCASFLV